MGSIIRRFVENSNRFKNFLQQKDVFIVIALFLITIASFAFGIMYEREKMVTMPTITTIPMTLTAITPQTASVATRSTATLDGKIVVSKNGSKYYFAWCSGATRIALKNRIFFANEAEAMSRGYTKAKGCE